MQLAQSMGIDLSALSATKDKVVSFAFGAPLFANATLHEALVEHKLQANLNTIWKPGDGAPAFFSACVDLAATRPKPDAPESGLPLIPHIPTAAFKAVQTWLRSLQGELQNLPKGSRTYAAEPLDEVELNKKLVASSASGATAPDAASSSPQPSPTGMQRSTSVFLQGGDRQAAKGPANSPARSVSVSGAAKAAVISSTAASAPKPSLLTAAKKVSMGVALGTPKGGASTKQRDSVSASEAISAAATVGPAWKSALQALLNQRTAALDAESPMAVHGVGQFWVLDPAKGGGAKASKPADGNEQAPSMTLVPLSAAHAAVSCFNWLATSNNELFTKYVLLSS